MRKKAVIAVILSLLVFTVVGFAIAGEQSIGSDNREALSEETEKYLYEVILEEEAMRIYKIKSGNKELLKSEKASPVRREDRISMSQGIKCKSLEEALMIFEDFIS